MNPLERRIKRMVNVALRSQETEYMSLPGMEFVASKNTNITARVVWAVLILLNIVVCLYHGIDRTAYYFAYPVELDLSTSDYPANYFPSITICAEQNERMLNVWKENMYLQEQSCISWVLHILLLISSNNMTVDEVWALSNTSILLVSSNMVYQGVTHPLEASYVNSTHGLCTSFSSNILLGNTASKKEVNIVLQRVRNNCPDDTVKVYVHDAGEDPFLTTRNMYGSGSTNLVEISSKQVIRSLGQSLKHVRFVQLKSKRDIEPVIIISHTYPKKEKEKVMTEKE